jgi:hypothetical protein
MPLVIAVVIVFGFSQAASGKLQAKTDNLAVPILKVLLAA